MIDESSDVSVHQNLVVYIRYLQELFGRVESTASFLGINRGGLYRGLKMVMFQKHYLQVLFEAVYPSEHFDTFF